MFEVATYRPTDVYLTISGHTIEGWLEITIRRNVEAFTPRRGIRGKNSRARNKDTSAAITVSLSQASVTNDIFTRIHIADMLEGTGKLAISLTDRSGSSVFKSNEAYIKGFPISSYVDDLTSRDWEIECQNSDFFVGGNANPPADVVSTILKTLGL